MLIAGLTVALAAWGAAPALSTAPYVPPAVDFAQRVPRADRTADRRGGVVLPVVRAPKRFDLVGFGWDDGRALRMEIRVRRDGEPWSRWLDLPSADSAPGRSDPIWTGGADAYQLRLGRRVSGLRAHFVNSTGTATGADRARTAVLRSVRAAVVSVAGAAAGANGADGAPEIVPREAWERGQCRPRDAAAHGEVQLGVVHHTVSSNAYAPEDSAAMVLAICRFHRNANGWDDIGYNFLVDRFGRVFEGRAGGVDQPVVGAHAQGYNSVSTGVAALGTHSEAPLGAESIGAVARLLAWKLSLHGVPVEGHVTVRSSGGSSNRHPEGREVTFERISGHRDGDRTTCPGDALFAQLPEIRRLAADHAAGLTATHATAEPALLPAKLQIARARVLRRARRLDLLAPISRRASGGVEVLFRAAGRSARFSVAVDSANGRVRVRRRIAAAQARLGTGIVTLRYPGGDRTRHQEVRLRAARRPARLTVVRPAIADGRLRAAGTIDERARGIVRVQLDYASGGRQRTLRFRASISDGRWQLDVPLADSALAEIAARQGAVHSYVLFTGYLPQRMRGEMRSLQVLGAP